MAVPAGVGLARILLLAGAGYSGTVLFKNRKLSDVLGDLQSVVKGLEKKRKSSEGDSESSDAIAAQVHRLAMEVRQLASSRQITVVDGGSCQIGNVTSLILPAAAMGAMGYAYMWWKGLSFSDLMYVTKHSMVNAVSNLTKQLDHVNGVIAAAKRHLTQRTENLDGKVDEQVEVSKLLRNEVSEVRDDISVLSGDLDTVYKMVSGLNGLLCTLEEKQDFANMAMLHLCSAVDGRNTKMPIAMQEQLKLLRNSRASLTSSESPKALMGIADSVVSEDGTTLVTDGKLQDFNTKLERPRILMRLFFVCNCWRVICRATSLRC